MRNNLIASWDIDGVIYLGKGRPGCRPNPRDVIITGRSLLDEEKETKAMLGQRGIFNQVFMNPLPFESKTRESSGWHKANTINGYNARIQLTKIDIHFEDDPIQADIIRANCPGVEVVMLFHDLVEKENVRHLDAV